MATLPTFISNIGGRSHIKPDWIGRVTIADMKVAWGEFANQGGASGGLVKTGLSTIYCFMVQPKEGEVSTNVASPANVLSTATSGGASTLTDTTQAMVVNAYTGENVYIVSGTGAGQLRVIASNTATQYTTSVAWTTQPDNTSVFVVAAAQPAANFAFAAANYPLASGDVTIATSVDAIGYWMAMGV